MGNTGQFDLTDPETVQKWEAELHVQVALRTPLMSKRYGFVGDSATSLVQKKSKVWDPDGTQATVTLIRELHGRATFGNQPLRGREETQNTATFKWQINQIRHAVQQLGRINKRRVTWDIWQNSKDGLGAYFAKVVEAAAMMHAAGVAYDVSTASEWYFLGNDLAHTFSNVPTAPDTKHIVRLGHETDTDDTNVGLDPAAVIDVDVISRLKYQFTNMPVPGRPAVVHDQELFVFFMHSYACRHLKDNSKWMSIMKAALQGGATSDHPFWTGALGIWDGVLIVDSKYVPPGLSSTNTRVPNARRNIFCGAQSLVFGVAKEFDKDNIFKNDEENWDYNNNKGIGATTLAGIAKPRYAIVEQGTTEDYGCLVCVSYAQELVTSA